MGDGDLGGFFSGEGGEAFLVESSFQSVFGGGFYMLIFPYSGLIRGASFTVWRCHTSCPNRDS